MQRKKILLLSIFVFLSVVVVGSLSWLNSSVQATQIRIHKKDIPHRGLVVVYSTDSSFDNDVNQWLQGMPNEYQNFARTLKPFSFFVKNTSNKDVIAYRLKWELTDSEGIIRTYSRNYFEPEALVGIKNSNNENIEKKRRLVRKNSNSAK